MKKLFLVLLVAVVSSGSAWAQKGMMGVGANIAMTAIPITEGGLGIGGGVKFQYNISDYFRIEPSFTYYADVDGNKATAEMAGLVNLHAFLSSPRTLRPYIFVGGGYVGINGKEKSFDDIIYDYNFGHFNLINEKKLKESRYGVDGGIGLDYRVSHHLSLQAEAGIMGAFGRNNDLIIKANIGACYTF